MYEEHPIPQQISSYQFRLVGDMTLKQFFQVAGGALVSLILYSSGLPGYVKWPLILISFLSGVAFAFFPFQDRPLSTWLLLFLKAIYSPTIFIWEKGSEIRQFFQAEPDIEEIDVSSVTQTPQSLQNSQVLKAKEEISLEQKEKKLLNQITLHFQSPQTSRQTKSFSIPAEGQELVVTKQPPIQIELQKHEFPKTKSNLTEGGVFQTIPSPLQTSQVIGTKQVQFSLSSSLPTFPSKPNVIVGQVIDEDQNIIEAALLEIKDREGRSVRALKSNKLGHFMIVTPLSDGEYQILTEKDGFVFDPLTFKVEGKIIPPIVIIGRKTQK